MERRTIAILGLLATATWACRPPAPAPAAAHDEAWSVTAWGERYEVFAETDALVAGGGATSNAHITVLDGFAPLRQGAVTAVLRGPDGSEESFRQSQPKREGIFAVELKPHREGVFDLVFRIESAAGAEDVRAGRVRVGSAGSPGGRADEPADAPDGVSFLKEQQWRTPFATGWVREGALASSVSGPARVTPAAGGEVLLTAPVEGGLAPTPWPHVGRAVAAGAAIFDLVPRVAQRSLPELRADVELLGHETDVARRRVERLEELLRLEATSPAELERARAALAGLEARLAAARAGVASAAGNGSSPVAVRAPWNGVVAAVTVTPGQTVDAGAALGRLVRTRPLWLVVALSPEEAARVQAAPAAVFVLSSGRALPHEISGRDVRLVARAPEVDTRTATVDVVLEVQRDAAEWPLGSVVETELRLQGESRGIVVPLSALLDDSGTTVAYVQVEGEAFARREVHVLGRLGSQASVTGLRPGERLVTHGGGAVRRASLLASSAPEGHVH